METTQEIKRTKAKVKLVFISKNGEKKEIVTKIQGTDSDHVYNEDQLIQDFMQMANCHKRFTIKNFCINMEYYTLAEIEVISG